MKTFEEIEAAVDAEGGVTTLPMWKVRNAYGADRLGVHVVEAISRKLRSRGLKHVPRRMPQDQNADVRIYRLDTPVGEVIEAAFNVGREHDRFLREVTSRETATLLQKIRELVATEDVDELS